MNPTLDGTCSAAAGMLTCQSGVCDPKDNDCGLADGDGPCANSEQCRNGNCNMDTMKCTAPKLPDGSACTSSDQCINSDCDHGICVSIIGSGNGLICAARPAGSGNEGTAGFFGLALALAGLARRRRR